MSIGNRIRTARKKAGLTQKELGKRLGISYQTIAQWENNLRNPKYETQQRIADALGVDIYDVLSDEQRISLDLAAQFKKLEGAFRVSALSSAHRTPPIALDLEKIDRELGLDTDPVWIAGNQLLEAFDKLNPEGQAKAVERVEELTEIPKYKK